MQKVVWRNWKFVRSIKTSNKIKPKYFWTLFRAASDWNKTETLYMLKTFSQTFPWTQTWRLFAIEAYIKKYLQTNQTWLSSMSTCNIIMYNFNRSYIFFFKDKYITHIKYQTNICRHAPHKRLNYALIEPATLRYGDKCCYLWIK